MATEYLLHRDGDGIRLNALSCYRVGYREHERYGISGRHSGRDLNVDLIERDQGRGETGEQNRNIDTANRGLYGGRGLVQGGERSGGAIGWRRLPVGSITGPSPVAKIDRSSEPL